MENLIQLVAAVSLKYSHSEPATQRLLNVYNYLSEQEAIARQIHRADMLRLHTVKFKLHVAIPEGGVQAAFDAFSKSYLNLRVASCTTDLVREIFNKENAPFTIGHPWESTQCEIFQELPPEPKNTGRILTMPPRLT